LSRTREAEVLRFGLDEIAAVNPQKGEDEALAAEAVRLADADDLKALAVSAQVALSGAEEDLDAPSVLGLAALHPQGPRLSRRTGSERPPSWRGASQRSTICW